MAPPPVLLPLVCAAALAGEAGRDAPWLGLDRALEEEPERSLEPSGSEIRMTWNDRLRFETVDKRARLEVMARVHVDATAQRASGDLGRLAVWDEDVAFRRASFGFQGRFGDELGYRLRFDFARNRARLLDAYVDWRNLPFGRLRIGQFREPFGLENHTAGDFLTFAERSVVNRLEPRRATGAMIFGQYAGDRGTWWLSLTRDSDDLGRATGDGPATVSARLSGLVRDEDDGRDLIHLGTSARLFHPVGDQFDVTLRPESFLAPTLLDTGNIDLDRALSYDAQFAWVRGPFSVQSEWTRSDGRDDAGGRPTLVGGYAFVSWFPTGESRVYRRNRGSFGRLNPDRPLGRGGGLGAFELAARYSYARLDDVPNAMDEDALRSVTLGLNWYQTANTRLIFNYITGEREELDGRFQIVLVRLQVSI